MERMTPNTQVATDHRRIDRLVYDHCGLTEDEVKIVEEATTVKS